MIRQEIQRVVEGAGEPVRLSEIANRLKRKKTTWLRNHVESLVKLGILRRERDSMPGNGRPAYVYSLAIAENGDFRREWQHWCEKNFPVSYELWLEDMLREARANKG